VLTYSEERRGKREESREKSEVLVAADLRANIVFKQALLRSRRRLASLSSATCDFFVVGDLRGHLVFVESQRESEREGHLVFVESQRESERERERERDRERERVRENE